MFHAHRPRPEVNGYSLPVLAGALAYLAGGAVPEPFAQQSLAVVVAVLTFAVMDLRREVGRLRNFRHDFAGDLQYLFGAVEILKDQTGANIPAFKKLPDERAGPGQWWRRWV